MNVIKKSDDELQIVWGELYVPGVLDSQNDFMSSDEVLKAAYRWMSKGDVRCIDIQHDRNRTDAYVVESFIARKGDPDFIEGAWVVGVHVPDPDIWAAVKAGKLNGFSMMGPGLRGPQEDVSVPSYVEGLTKAEDGHVHNFSVEYGPNGEFIGGRTDEVDGHYHIIRRGTLTEKADGHVHQFDFVRGVMANVEAEEEDDDS